MRAFEAHLAVVLHRVTERAIGNYHCDVVSKPQHAKHRRRTHAFAVKRNYCVLAETVTHHVAHGAEVVTLVVA